ncbi:group 1 glycosyl transferase [Siphonobacter sp. BAB-5385]|uniref:glycosyltransferase n=1 Tax=Siphonobacter sp. BAB-5385 TaxID=1864822 RepID=UPI000B9E5FA5|nr:glycosyltransferase [Siphonobacter sp. BAB-5385]OZI08936.1 group 1 glycosyl transferase [Siphonobacter sp. BAB-5385]
MKPNVLHLSTLHRGDDSRMVLKMAVSTALRYPTTVLATPPLNSNTSITFLPIPYESSLLKRLLFVHPQVLWHSLRVRADIVHVHAPEALPIALLNQWLGSKVIFDAYENMAKQLDGKQINNGRLFRWFFRLFDRIARRKFYFIFAEDSYLESYTDVQKPSIVLHNFPDLSLFPSSAPSTTGGPPAFFYLGQISKARCLDVMIEASRLLRKEYPDFRWHIFGKPGFDLRSFEEIEQLPGYEEVKENLIFHGHTPAPEAYRTGAGCLGGVALLRPIGDFPGSYPSKIFEYMALGLPVVTSNFPLYQSVVEENECGFCIDPTDAEQLYESLKILIEQPAVRTQMGERGKRAVRQRYNWAYEQQRLLDFYERILQN